MNLQRSLCLLKFFFTASFVHLSRSLQKPFLCQKHTIKMSSTEHLPTGPPAFESAYPERALVRHYPSSESLSDSELSTTSSNSSSGTTISSRPSISLEKEKNQIAEKKGIHGLRALRYRFFCIYRRLLTVVFFGNIVAMILILISPKEWQLDTLAIEMAANLTASVLIRQDHIVNLIYRIVCSVPKSSPTSLTFY
jgi:hypothetical protein